MTTWQTLKYGTKVITGLAVTGTLIWFVTRTQIKAVDIIEIFQGTYERCLATRWSDDTFYPNVLTTVRYLTFGTNDPSGLAYYTWTDTVHRITNYYKTVTATNDAIVTNRVPGGKYMVYPPRIRYLQPDLTGNRYIWGGYTQYVFSGMSGVLAVFYNGTYQLSNSTHSEDIFVNTNGSGAQLRDFKTAGYWDLDGAWNTPKYYTARFAKWRGSGALNMANLKVVASGLNSNYLTSMEVMTNIVEVNAMDWHTDGALIRANTPEKGDVPWVYLKTLTYQADALRALIAAPIDPPHSYSNVLLSPYVDDTQSDMTGIFSGFSELPGNTHTQFVARIGFGRTAFLSELDYYVMLFDDETNTTGDVRLNYWPITKTNLQHRYQTLNALKWTHIQPLWTGGNVGIKDDWYDDGTDNTWIWRGSSTNSWAEATARCTNLYWATTTHGHPYYFAVGERYTNDGGSWAVYVFARRSMFKVTGLTTAITHTIDFYNKCVVPSNALGGFRLPFDATQKEFYAYSSPVSNNIYRHWYTTGKTNGSWAFSSSLGVSNLVESTIWPVAPTIPQVPTIKGWMLTNRDCVVKWDFSYCTNAIP